MEIKLSCDELIATAPTVGFIFIPGILFADAPAKGKPLTPYEAFHCLCAKVNHTDKNFPKKGKWVTCKRGESIRSMQTWAGHFGWTVEEVQKFFIELLILGYLERPEKAISPDHIRIRHFEKLTGKDLLIEGAQGQEKKSITRKGNNPNNGAAGAQMVPGGGTPPPKPAPATAEMSEQERMFNEFMKIYHEVTNMPRLGQGKARRIWYTLTPEKQDEAIDMIEEYYDNLTDKKYCRRAASYLENEIE